MSLPGGFDVDAEALEAHARFLDHSVVAPLREAAAAARPLDHLAYGIVGRVFAVAAAGAVAAGVERVALLAAQAEGFSGHVRAAARSYRDAERAAAAALDGPP